MTIDEIVLGVDIVLGKSAVSLCSPLDEDKDALVTIEEVVRGVVHALDGCPE